MSRRNSNSSDLDQNLDPNQCCVVCFKTFEIFSVGVCDHPVCYECSTRMRVLCRQNECPICRGEMCKVIFTSVLEPFNILEERCNSSSYRDAKYGLFFLSQSIQKAYYRLLDNECFICKNKHFLILRNFAELKEHMRKEHDLFYCDLCIQNLRIFSSERKCYTRIDLGIHRRKGDVDNTSHRGHPLCQFCDTRFMDNDELYRHLRRDHYYCHFCDADGKHQYYNMYDDLRKHYLKEHFLCEEGECKYEKFTSVFRTTIDLKAHVALVHGKHLSKAATKLARTLELEFTLAPRYRPGGGPSGSRRRGESNYNYHDQEEGAVGYSNYNVETGGNDNTENKPRESNVYVNALNAENFPSLGGEPSTSNNTRAVSNVYITTSKKLNPLSEEDFPSLGNKSTTSITTTSNPPTTTATTTDSSAVTITTSKNNPNYSIVGSSRKKPSGVTITRTVKQPTAPGRDLSDFPALGEPARPSTSSVRFSVNSGSQEIPTSSNVSIHVNHNADGVITTHISRAPNSEEFPALPKRPEISAPQWVRQKNKKQQESKSSKVAPAPILPPSSLNHFPALGKGDKGKKSNSVAVSTNNSWVNLNNYNNQSKSKNGSGKEKNEVIDKQQNNEKKTVNNKNASNNNTTGSNNNNNKKKKGKSTDNTNIDVSKKVESNNETLEENSINSTRNGLVPNKKRSELKIENLINEQDFPPLGASTKPTPPPGFNVKPTAPPGFSSLECQNNKPTASLYDALSTDLTFTNSSGQSYPILPPTSRKPFIIPQNFQFRNRMIFEKISQTKEDRAKIQKFKIVSEMFRSGTISAIDYYEHCHSLMGSDFGYIFPELIVLLPDIEKQQELYKEHVRNESNTKEFEVCASCNQVVLADEIQQHVSNHTSENHFQGFDGSVNVSDSNKNVWNKKK